jgi:hypothetical protein
MHRGHLACNLRPIGRFSFATRGYLRQAVRKRLGPCDQFERLPADWVARHSKERGRRQIGRSWMCNEDFHLSSAFGPKGICVCSVSFGVRTPGERQHAKQ